MARGSKTKTRLFCLLAFIIAGQQTYVALTENKQGYLFWSVPVALIALVVFIVPRPRPMRRR